MSGSANLCRSGATTTYVNPNAYRRVGTTSVGHGIPLKTAMDVTKVSVVLIPEDPHEYISF